VKTLSAFIFVWGLVCILTVVVEDYRGLVVQRVFLGLTEVSLKWILCIGRMGRGT
jgi:hypothetical protein